MGEGLFLSLKQVWKEINKDSESSNFSGELLLHNKLLNFFHVGDYYYYIFNLETLEIEFVQDQMMQVLGFSKVDFTPQNIFASIHPEDQLHFLNFENTIKNFFNNLPVDKIEKYKVRYDYRIQNVKGEYVRMLQQVVTIQHAVDGGILRTLGMHTDITHLKTENKPILCFIGLDGEPSYYDVKPDFIKLEPSKLLTNRETEIVNLIASGYKTKEISKLLFVHVTTVETHRKNILKKTQCKTSNELIQKALKMGWI